MDQLKNETVPELPPLSAQDRRPPASETEELVVPVLQEELTVQKQLRKTGTVRVRKTVREREEAVSESLASETVEVQRIPTDRIVDSPPPVRTEGEVTIIPVVQEELVLTRQWRVIEEVRLTKRRSVSEYHETVAVRAEEVVIERVPADSDPAESGET